MSRKRKVKGAKAAVGVASLLWKHRKRLAPVYIWLGLTIAALALGGVAPGWWSAPVWVGAVAALLVWLVGERMSGPIKNGIALIVPDSVDQGRRGVLDRPSERAYLSILLASAGGWMGMVASYGLGRDVLLGGMCGLLAFCAPWWWHRRIRRNGVLNIYARRWPVVAEEVLSFQGSRVMPEGVTKVGGRGRAVVLDVALRPGKTVDSVGSYASNVASVFNLRGGAVTIAPGRTARRILVRIVPRDPWEAQIRHPLFENPPAGPLRLADSMTFPMGVLDDGDLVMYSLFHTLVIGQSGSGKSSFIESMLIWLLSHEDAVCVGSDMAGGATLGVWEPAFELPIATDVDSSLELIARLRQVIDYRLQVLNDRKRRGGITDDTLPPSPEFPAIVAFFDEWPTLVAEGSKEVVTVMGVMAKQGRKVNVWLVLASQNATKADVGATELRGQMRMVGFRLDSQQNKNAWKEKVNQGWSSTDLPTGVFLLNDDQHTIPRQAKGFFVNKNERGGFIGSKQGSRVPLDSGSKTILCGGETPVVGVLEAEVVEERQLDPAPSPASRFASVTPPKRSTTAELVRAELVASGSPMRPAELAEQIGKSVDSVNKALRSLVAVELVSKTGHGLYEVTDRTE